MPSISEENWQKLKEYEKEFLKNINNKNPYFRGTVLDNLRPKLFLKLIEILNEKGMDSNEYYFKTKEIIDLNSDYPCNEKNPFTCPKTMRDINYTHILSYPLMIRSAFMSNENWKKNEACEYTKDFVERFYSVNDFEEGNFDNIGEIEIKYGNNSLSVMAFNCGRNSEQNNNLEEAIKFFDIASKVKCLEQGYDNYDSCLVLKERAKEELKRLKK